MIIWLKNWANQIIVAVIIATILEMILPDGNNKKYIKMIIGVYVLFTIIQPVITKVTGKEISIKDFDYNKYLKTDTSQVFSNIGNFENDNSKLIEQAYIENIKNDIKEKIKQKGYELENCDIDIEKNNEKYGIINYINIDLMKVQDTNKNNINVKINEVNISNNIAEKDIKKTIMAKDEIKLIKEYIANEYSVDIEKIYIN